MKIISADNVSVIEDQTKNLDENSLVIFDCDNVLTTVKVGTFSVQNRNFLKNYLHEEPISKDEFYDKIRLVLVNEIPYIVNQRMVDLVSNLLEKNIRHMVATSYSVRPLKGVSDPMQWRIDNLHKMGYFFEKSWMDQKKNIALNDFGTDHIAPPGLVPNVFVDLVGQNIQTYRYLRPIAQMKRQRKNLLQIPHIKI